MRPGKEHLEEHYADLAKRPFFPGLVKYMDSGPVVAMCWEGDGAVKTGRVCSGRLIPKTVNLAPSEETIVYRLEEIFATAQMLLSLPIMKLSSGSRRRTFVTGLLPMTSGSMKETKKLTFKKYILVAVVNP